MTTGTKIFLAVFALIVGILVVYYGVVVPKRQAALNLSSAGDVPQEPAGDSALVAGNSDPSAPPRSNPPPRDPAPTAQPINSSTPPAYATNGGLLSEGLREAAGEPAVNQHTPRPGSFLPLIGLNAGDMQAQPVSNSATPAQPSPPSDTARTNTQSPAPSDRSSIPPARIAYVIEAGDTFSSVAEGWFGDATKWSLIAKANPTIDPQRLKVGQKIYLPPKDAATVVAAKPEPVATNGEPIYLVQSGDTLMRIARNVLGDGAKWEDIYQLNRAAIGKDPAALQVGMKLKLPKKTT